jgi:tetratricopeptide (TPR) repeat protein
MRLFVLISVVVALQAGCAGQPAVSQDSRDIAEAPAPISERGEATYHLMLGEMALKRGQLEEAATQYRLAAQRDSDPQTAEKALELALMVGDQDEALLSARRWYELSPGEIEPTRQYASLLLEAGKTSAAVKVLRELVKVSGASGEPHPELILLSMGLDMDDSAQALKTMKKVVGKRPDSAAAMLVLSSLALVAGEDEEAEKYARGASVAEPEWNAAGMQLARVLVGSGRVDQGLEIARKQVAAGSDLSSRLDFAGLLSMVGKYSEAGLMLEQMLLERPGLPPALRMMGYVEYQVGRLENARRYYARLAASGRYMDEAYYYMALIALDEGDTETAIEIFKLVAEGDFFLAAQFGVRDAYVKDG